ncbi:tyrosine-protein phosphatase [Lentibacillus saliphilus]|uniref:tyrosine-protein phosphatase n=1 Tax=Lentibacillus saliphilus TaxID=2737028 RepID=UPI001C301101|nr:CpsB/CapC family capsule biosynthesis tyrosine phosphatase [Lentibacillus saliphilus]
MSVDIHNHLLWDIDDGPAQQEDAIQLAHQAVKQGISDVIATPHFRLGYAQPSVEAIKERTKQFNKLLAAQQIPLTVHSGMEIQLFADLDTALNTNEMVLSLNGSPYVLIEMPTTQIPHYIEDLFFNMQMRGFIPVIAHAEKNPPFQKNPDQLVQLIEKGALVQISARSLTHHSQRSVRKFANQLIQHRAVHLIASDAHHVEKRPFLLTTAYKAVRKTYGLSYTAYFKKNARLVLNGQSLFIHPPIPFNTRKSWQVFMK